MMADSMDGIGKVQFELSKYSEALVNFEESRNIR